MAYAEPPMTREELEDTIAAAITSHSLRSGPDALNWEISLVMSAVDKYIKYLQDSNNEEE